MSYFGRSAGILPAILPAGSRRYRLNLDTTDKTTAIDADTRLAPSFMVGNRDAKSANIFIDDLKSRLANRVHLTTDGLKVYLEAVEGAFGADIDYAQWIKIYGASQEEARYSPAGVHRL